MENAENLDQVQIFANCALTGNCVHTILSPFYNNDSDDDDHVMLTMMMIKMVMMMTIMMVMMMVMRMTDNSEDNNDDDDVDVDGIVDGDDLHRPHLSSHAHASPNPHMVDALLLFRLCFSFKYATSHQPQDKLYIYIFIHNIYISQQIVHFSSGHFL